jgi:hypothetical protein
MRSLKWGALAALLTLVAGCSTPVKQVRIAEQVSSSDAWEAVVAEHTSRAVVFDGADRKVDLRATLITPRLRSAFVAARDRLYGRVTRDFNDELVALGLEESTEEEVLVVVTFYASDLKHRDLAASYTIWDTTLARGKARVDPKALETERFSPALKALFPHADRFDSVYLVRFPVRDEKTGTTMFSPGDDPLTLEVKSAIAEAVVGWKLRD